MQEDAKKQPVFTGRRRIYTTYNEITEDNLIKVLTESLAIHAFNVSQITYLWRYYKGIQPILEREKDVRPEICNRVVENHAQEIVAFKIGYQLFEPIQYVSRTGEDEEGLISNQIKHLNTLMFAENKESRDRDLFEWLYIAGVAYRLILPDKEDEVENGGAPYEIFIPDPRTCFVVRTANYSHKPLMAVYIGIDEDEKPIYNIYTKDTFYLVKNNQIISVENHICGNIPIVEYDLNNARMGVFEPVLPILDSINAIESNRLDGVEQTVQCLMKFINCDVSEEDFTELLKLGAVKVRSVDGQQGDVDILKNDLDQTQTQVTKDDLYQTMYNIVGMPNITANNGSGGDTGVAVLLRDGWTLAESHAKSYELKFKESEQDFLRIILNICSISNEDRIDLRIRDIEMAFNRRNYENSLTKTQVLTTMLDNEKVHPLLAFQSCGLFTDPEAAYIASVNYAERIKQENMQKAVDIANGNTQNILDDTGTDEEVTDDENTQGSFGGEETDEDSQDMTFSEDEETDENAEQETDGEESEDQENIEDEDAENQEGAENEETENEDGVEDEEAENQEEVDGEENDEDEEQSEIDQEQENEEETDENVDAEETDEQEANSEETDEQKADEQETENKEIDEESSDVEDEDQEQEKTEQEETQDSRAENSDNKEQDKNSEDKETKNSEDSSQDKEQTEESSEEEQETDDSDDEEEEEDEDGKKKKKKKKLQTKKQEQKEANPNPNPSPNWG